MQLVRVRVLELAPVCASLHQECDITHCVHARLTRITFWLCNHLVVTCESCEGFLSLLMSASSPIARYPP